jgi:hypothetical protein
MTSSLLQLVLALLALVCAAGVRRYACVLESPKWVEIMEQISIGREHRAGLSFLCPFMEGIECQSKHLWDNLGGTMGLWSIFKNLGVLLRALEYIESNYSSCSALTRMLIRLRAEAIDTRITILITLVRQWARFFLGDSDTLLRESAGRYFAVIAQLSHAIRDYCPELLDPFVSRVSQV